MMMMMMKHTLMNNSYASIMKVNTSVEAFAAIWANRTCKYRPPALEALKHEFRIKDDDFGEDNDDGTSGESDHQSYANELLLSCCCAYQLQSSPVAIDQT